MNRLSAAGWSLVALGLAGCGGGSEFTVAREIQVSGGGSTGALGGGTSGGKAGADGIVSSGGNAAAGGSTNAAGAASTGGAGGTSAGGAASTGGAIGTSSGGNATTGGSVGTGGDTTTGGSVSTGGSTTTGGTTSTGGASVISLGGSIAVGGSSAKGGTGSTGGTKATGGSSAVNCASLRTQYSSTLGTAKVCTTGSSSGPPGPPANDCTITVVSSPDCTNCQTYISQSSGLHDTLDSILSSYQNANCTGVCTTICVPLPPSGTCNVSPPGPGSTSGTCNGP
jgi:hypothetical protein